MVKALTDATEAYLRAQARAAATFAETGEVVSLAALRERVADLTDILAGASLVRQASQSATSTGFQNRGTDPNRLTSGQLDGLCSRLAAERAESCRPKF